MTDLDALARAVRDHPADDTPRLIYADALEDVGGSARAAFVRADVEAARAAEYEPAAIRAHFSDEHADAREDWLANLPELPVGLWWAKEPFRRGFPAAVAARDGAAFVAGADELFAAYPVESLELAAVPAAGVAALADCSWLARLARLSLPAGVGQSIARRLLNSPHLSRLADLDIGPGLTSPQTAAVVVGSHAFRRLSRLSYRDERGAMATALTRLADPPELQTLDLRGNRITAERVARLVGAPVLAGVADLDLGDNHLGPDGVTALAGASLPALRSLRLAGARPGMSGLAALAGAGFLPELRLLNLGGNNLGPWAARLVEAPAATLRVLDLRDNRLGDHGAETLAGSASAATLLHLDLAGNGIEDAGAAALAESPHLAGLLALDLTGNLLTDAAKQRLRDRFGERVLV